MKTMNPIYYKDPHCVLVINNRGSLRILHTPFRVRPVCDFEMYKTTSIVWVEEVLESGLYILVYRVNNRLYPYWYFNIIIGF
jgi:hypothetical protein